MTVIAGGRRARDVSLIANSIRTPGFGAAGDARGGTRKVSDAHRSGREWGEAAALLTLMAMEQARDAGGMQAAMNNLGRLFSLAVRTVSERSGKAVAVAFASAAIAIIHDLIAGFDDILDPTAYRIRPRPAQEAIPRDGRAPAKGVR